MANLYPQNKNWQSSSNIITRKQHTSGAIQYALPLNECISVQDVICFNICNNVRCRTKTQKYLVLAFILQKELPVATGVMFSSYGEHDPIKEEQNACFFH
jgi:hypothetical protein